jgi:hypothetical protein
MSKYIKNICAELATLKMVGIMSIVVMTVVPISRGEKL